MSEPDPESEPGTRASERVLKTDRDAYRSIFQRAPVPMLLCEVGTLTVLAANDRAAELHGTSPERMLGTSLFELRKVPDLTAVMLKRAVGREISLGFAHHTRQDGSVFPARLSVHPSELGARPVWLCVLDNLEEEAAPSGDEQQRRLDEALGRLSGGIAHDLNNLLSVILSFANLASAQLNQFAPERVDLAEIRGAAERAAAITKQVLALSRRTPGAPKPVRLNELVSRLEKLLRRLLDEHLVLELQLDEGVDPVLVDASMLERVLVQLAYEARQTSPRGAKLQIQVRHAALERPSTDDRHVILTVSGGGLSPEVGTRLFEPIAGSVWLETETDAGGGTRVVACFPTVREPSARAGAEPRKSRPEVVLVVQDNAHLRKTLKTYFCREGYRVLDADCSIEAERLAVGAPRLDLLLTDFVLPDGSGVELGNILRRQRPALKLLVTIGHPDERAAVPLHEQTATIDKPFELQRFGQLIEHLLEPQTRD